MRWYPRNAIIDDRFWPLLEFYNGQLTRKMGCAFMVLLLVCSSAPRMVRSQATHNVQCGPIDTACECDAGATVCIFQFYVENVFTFTRYNSSRPYSEGELVYIDESGNVVSHHQKGICLETDFVKYTRFGYNGVPVQAYCIWNNDTQVCINKNDMCTDPITVDGRTFKTVLAVNKQFPGPTLVVWEGQTVAVDVHNNLSSEGVSIHWHGQEQRGTNYMDGVGLITQCPIQPGSSFRYIFMAKPSGTFWYHSHMGSQRANGLFGAFIVKEKELSYPIEFEDDPAVHTLTIMDWYQEDFESLFLRERFAVGSYPDLPYFTAPSPPTKIYHETVGPDHAEIGNLPFWCGLMHGKGRHSSVPYERSNLQIYEVERSKNYRFRLIHTGVQYAFKFSINDHSLTVMATDGYIIQPVEVDYIALHSGERYDFLLEANQGRGDYWMKAETFEVDFINSNGLPYKFHEHSAEAILHYVGSEKPNPSQYHKIPQYPKVCTQERPCKMLNCPFGEFHHSYNIECVSIDNLRLISPTSKEDMPDENPDVTYFMNVAGFVDREKPISSINDKNFKFPLYPLTTHYKNNQKSSFCDVTSKCYEKGGCKCVTVVDLDYNATVRIVLSAVGVERNATHPMHIHGHSVHVLKVGHGKYSKTNGTLMASSRDLICTENRSDVDTLDQNRCPNPHFRSPDIAFSMDEFTVRKDSITVPSGGYVVLQFRSNNPGFWFLHCHVELHQREGMVLVIQEAVHKINRPPMEMETCGTFLWDIDSFNATVLQLVHGSGCAMIRISLSLCIVVVLFIGFSI